jgi:hypothetical protein
MPEIRKEARYRKPRTSFVVYIEPDLLADLDARTKETGLSRNETVIRMIRNLLGKPAAKIN